MYLFVCAYLIRELIAFEINVYVVTYIARDGTTGENLCLLYLTGEHEKWQTVCGHFTRQVKDIEKQYVQCWRMTEFIYILLLLSYILIPCWTTQEKL